MAPLFSYRQALACVSTVRLYKTPLLLLRHEKYTREVSFPTTEMQILVNSTNHLASLNHLTRILLVLHYARSLSLFLRGIQSHKGSPPPNSIQILANLVFQKRGNLLVLHRSQRITHLSLQQMSLVMVLEKNVVLPGAEIREKTFAFLKASAQAMKIIEAKNYAFKKTTLTSTKRCFFQWMKHSWKIWLLTGDQSKPKGKAVWKNRTRFN